MNPKPTLRKTWAVLAWCEHCAAKTLQIKSPVQPGPDPNRVGGGQFGTCLQCIADGGTCCTLRHLNRWPRS